MHDRRGHRAVPVPRLHAAALALAVAALTGACVQDGPSGAPASPSTGPTAITSTPVPGATPSDGTDPTPVATLPPSVAQPCAAADLKASHGLVEGAAGSRLTEVVLVSALPCSIDAFPVLGLRDADGDAVVGGIPAGSGRLDLVAGRAYTSAVRIADWCLPEPAFPLTLLIRLGAEELPVTGGSFPDEEGGMPQCSGGPAPILEGGPWTASEP